MKEELLKKLNDDILCELTDDEIKFLYSDFDYTVNNELAIMRKNRDSFYEDLTRIYDKSIIAQDISEINEKTKIYIGDLFIDGALPTYNLKYVYGSLNFSTEDNIHLENLENFYGAIFLKFDCIKKINLELIINSLVNYEGNIAIKNNFDNPLFSKINNGSCDYYLSYGDFKWTMQIASEFVNKHNLIIQCIPDEFITYEMAKKVVNCIGAAICFVPNSIIDRNLVLKAIDNDPFSIKYVPEEYIDSQIFYNALYFGGNSILLGLSEKVLDKELIHSLLDYNPFTLRYLPEKYFDKELAVKLMDKEPEEFDTIPLKYLDKEMCLKAVKHDGTLLECVPDYLMDKEIIMATLDNDYTSIEFIPKELIDSEIISFYNKMKLIEESKEHLKTL